MKQADRAEPISPPRAVWKQVIEGLLLTWVSGRAEPLLERQAFRKPPGPGRREIARSHWTPTYRRNSFHGRLPTELAHRDRSR